MPNSYSFNSYGKTEVSFSITNGKDDEKRDSVKPFSFIDFINYSRQSEKDSNTIDLYKVYLQNWNKILNKSSTESNDVVKDQFINLFKEISLKFTSPEEKRDLQNIDFSDEENLSIAVPFFSRKIKEIILYYQERRKTYNKNYEELFSKGNKTNVTNYIKSKLIDFVENDETKDVTTKVNKLSTIQKFVEVEIEDSYDIFNDYFDIDPSRPPDFYVSKGEYKNITFLNNIPKTTTTTTTTPEPLVIIDPPSIQPLVLPFDGTNFDFFVPDEPPITTVTTIVTSGPGEGYERWEACFRGVIIKIESGVITESSTTGGTTNNVNMTAALVDHVPDILSKPDGDYPYVFSFYGWRRRANTLYAKSWRSDDTKFDIYELDSGNEEDSPEIMNYVFNIDFNLTNIPVTSFDPAGNENDRPRINTFREDGNFLTHLSAGGVYIDPSNTQLSSVPPWGDRTTGSESLSVPTVSGIAGDAAFSNTLSAGVDVFASSTMTVQLSPDNSNWLITDSNPNEKKYQLLVNTASAYDIGVIILP